MVGRILFEQTLTLPCHSSKYYGFTRPLLHAWYANLRGTMKTNKRSVPLDMLSVTDGKKYICISTNKQELSVNVRGELSNGSMIWHSEGFTFSEFHAILQKAVNEKQNKESQ